MIEYFLGDAKDRTLFIISNEKKFAFLNISKNAVTSLKSLVLEQRGLYNLDHNSIHRMIGHFPNQYNVKPEDMENYEKENGNFIKFAVIRDPVSRLLSTYKLFWLDNFPHAYFQKMKISLGINTFDKFIYWVENFEFKKPIDLQDEHIRKQSEWFRYEDLDLDYIVPIENLNNFVKNILCIDTFNIKNQSSSKINITKEQRSILEKLYKDDYDFINSLPKELIYKI